MEIPSFLQSKPQVTTEGSRVSRFFRNKKNISIISLVILLLAIPVTIWLLQSSKVFYPKAVEKPIELVSGTGSCVVSADPAKVNCATFPIKLTSPLELLTASSPASSSASPSVTPSPHVEPVVSPSPSAAITSPTPTLTPTHTPTPTPEENPWFNDPNNNGFLMLPQNLAGFFEKSLGSALYKLSSQFSLRRAFAQSGSKLITAAPNPCIIGANGLCTSTITLNATGYPNLQIKLRETGTPFTGVGANPTGSWVAPWIYSTGYTFDLYSDSTLIDSILVKGMFASPSPSPSGSVVPSPSPSVSPSPTASPVTPVRTVSYKVSETEAGLQSAAVVSYAEHPTVTNFTFKDTVTGSKQIWAEFIGSDGSSQKEHIPVELLEPDPALSSLDCSMDISKQDLKLTLNGSRLGGNSGKVTADSKDAKILSWGNDQVTAVIKPEGALNDSRVFKVVVTRNDGKALPEITCQVNTTLISLGARLFCREPGKFDLNGVKVTLVDENGNKVNEEVTIDKDGIVKGLKTKLQVGKLYAISVKSPFSLRRNALFTAANGTNLITPEDHSIFVLPVGDIAPVILSDGKINTLDHAEIVRQWSVFGTAVKTADFNKDSKVNSIDWACMRYDFNKEDDAIPATATLPTPPPSPSTTPSSSAQASSSPQASSQRAAYFLIEPTAGTSYKNGDEFIVNLDIWSQKEGANLFVAKIAFDPSALEVSRIERGTPLLTSWAEEFFDNQSGQISLTAGLPTPGLRTTEDTNNLMARVIFKGKKAGLTNITVTSASKIYSNSDNQNILTSLLSSQIAITN
jgi:hypothetical protein